MTVSGVLEKICVNAYNDAFSDVLDKTGVTSVDAEPHPLKTPKIVITEASSEEFGHFQCNYALQVAKQLKMSPKQVAEKWLDKIKLQPETNEILDTIEIKGPGFINFRVKPNYLAHLLQQNMQDPLKRFGIAKDTKPLKIIIDYSSPNIAKEMHVGHLRTTIIGDCLNRVFRFLGHDVLALNHIGDWGTQFGMLITYLKIVFPDIEHSLPHHVNVSDLVQWYKEAKKRFDEDPEFKKQAQLEVVALQGGEKNSRKIWQHICDISRTAYQQIYTLLEIDPRLTERGESYYDPMLADIVQRLEQKGLVTISDGAKCIFLEGFTNREGEPLPLILQKADGGYNYSTTDLAAIYHRAQEEKGDCIFYVVDSGQSLHFQMVFKAAEKAGFYDPKKIRVEHVPFGLVLRSDGKKFKTREGDTERLIDLIQNAILKSADILKSRSPELSNSELQLMSNALGINAIKYADLSCHRESDYTFSYDKMLSFEGNTAAFIMYAYVRILSIQRKINMSVEHLMAQHEKIVLATPAEMSLGLLLCQFQDVLLKMKQDLLPSRLTEYLYRLADKFHLFFHQCRVEGSPEQNSRLLLCIAVAQVLEQGMKLLGLKPLERM